MAGQKRIDITDTDLSGFKYFEKLKPLFARLHDVGCVRDQAGNRELHYDEYCTLILLFLFNPIVTSLRGLQQASELQSVQKKLGVPRASLGSLSEARQVFDPELLQPIIAELAAQAQPLTRDPRLQDVKQLLTLVDGTLLSALPRMAQASHRLPQDRYPTSTRRGGNLRPQGRAVRPLEGWPGQAADGETHHHEGRSGTDHHVCRHVHGQVSQRRRAGL